MPDFPSAASLDAVAVVEGDAQVDFGGAVSLGAASSLTAVASLYLPVHVAFFAPHPTISISVIVGGVLTASLEAPVPTLSSYGEAQATFEAPVPTLLLSAVSGSAIVAAFSFPVPAFDATGDAFGVASLEGLLPFPTVVLEGVTGGVAVLTLEAPVPGLDIDAVGRNLISGALSFPVPTLDVSLVLGTVATAAFVAPVPTISSLVALFLDQIETWALNSRVLAHSKYSSFDFTSFASLNGKVYGARADGLYLLEGDDDAGEPIVSVFRTGLDDLGDERLKTAPVAYLGANLGGTMQLRVKVDGNSEFSYLLGRMLHEAGQQPTRFVLGKGLRSRYWQLELSNVDGANFVVDSIGLVTQSLNRKT